MMKATAEFTVLSSEHCAERQLQRGVKKIDLQTAVKNGKKEMSTFGRWKYTFADVVYITDPSSKQAISTWILPSQDLEKANVSGLDVNDHDTAKEFMKKDFNKCTAHTVVVVDQSGSMRNFDVAGCGTRSDAVFSAVAKDFVAAHLRSGFASNSEIVSIIGMGDCAKILLDREPMTWVLYNKILDLKRTCSPRSHGNFLPSLKKAEEVIAKGFHDNIALHLMFLSDGKPSDTGIDHAYRGDYIADECRKIAKRFSGNMSFKMIGFGHLCEFGVLEKMTEYVLAEGVSADFVHSKLDTKTLSIAMSSSLTSVTKTIADVTMRAGRTAKSLLNEQTLMSPLALQSPLSTHWDVFPDAFIWEYDIKTDDFVRVSIGSRCGIAVCKYSLGDGAERVAYRLREVDFSQTPPAFTGQEMVAKESKYIESDPDNMKIQFHRVFCNTQKRAQHLAIFFNDELKKLPCFNPSFTPHINFLDCCVYAVNNDSKHFLVEKMLDVSNCKKWNDNAGGFNGQVVRPCLDLHGALGAALTKNPLDAIVEDGESDEEGSDDDSEDHDLEGSFDKLATAEMPLSSSEAVCGYTGSKSVKLEDFPQAFSHFTHRYSNRKFIVCDLQGVWNPNSSPPMFELTDPVIHYKSSRGRKRVFGRTDRGKAGVDSFFMTHQCSDLCSMILPEKGRKRK